MSFHWKYGICRDFAHSKLSLCSKKSLSLTHLRVWRVLAATYIYFCDFMVNALIVWCQSQIVYFFYFFLVLICSALFVSLLSDLDIFVFTKDRFNVLFIIDLCLIILFCFVLFFFSGICLVRYFLFNPRSLLLEDKERAGRKRLVALKENLKKKKWGKIEQCVWVDCR